MKGWGVTIIGCALPLLLVIPATAQSPKEVLVEYFAAIGGADTWKDITRLKEDIEGTTFESLDTTVVKRGLHTSYFKSPNFSFSIITSEEGRKSRMYLNDRRSGAVLNGQFYEMPNEFRYINSEIALTVRDLFVYNRFKDIRQFSDGDVSFDVLVGTTNPLSDTPAEYYFNRSTHLLEFVRYSEDGISRMESYKGYHWVGNYKVPFVRELRNDGLLVFRSVRRSIDFNPDFDDSIFYYEEGTSGIDR